MRNLSDGIRDMDFRTHLRSRSWSRLLALFALLFAVSVCSEDATPPGTAPSVLVSGAQSPEVGASVTLSATTRDGADSAYRWSSARKDVASVDDAGTVTGVAAGEAIITATGVDSGASADHVVVVVPLGTETVIVSITGNPFVE